MEREVYSKEFVRASERQPTIKLLRDKFKHISFSVFFMIEVLNQEERTNTAGARP